MFTCNNIREKFSSEETNNDGEWRTQHPSIHPTTEKKILPSLETMSSTTTSERRPSIIKETSNSKDVPGVPSGFVLKLYQMVTGASDEIISWTDSGDAFRISDLTRLENETLPTYFRHRRFQSLVRQLNFYNFRKVNRERNFWVYKHPLFHRDRPEELHLLRRRTCPGIDGRKARPDNVTSDKESATRKSVYSPQNDFDHKRVFAVTPNESSDSDEESSIGGTAVSDTFGSTVSGKKRSIVGLSAVAKDQDPPEVLSNMFVAHHVVESKKPRIETVHTEHLAHCLVPNPNETTRLVSPLSKDSPLQQSDVIEQTALVTKVSRQLDEHAKRAVASLGKSFLKKRTSGLIPTFFSDTMKFHALTYDDEVDIYEHDQSHVDEVTGDDALSTAGSESNVTLVSFSENETGRGTHDRDPQDPIFDAKTVCQVVKKLCEVRDDNISELTIAIAEFCMRTDPQDPLIGEKAIQLMSRHADLAQEFCCYKIALTPNSENHEECMIALFSGQSKDTIRGFKTFVLNRLKDLLRQLQYVTIGGYSSTLTKCYNIWFSGVTFSAQ